MVRFLVFLALAHLLVLMHAAPTSSDVEDKWNDIFRKCNITTPTDPILLAQLRRKGKFDENVNTYPAQCFLRCIFIKSGMMSATGDFDTDAIQQTYFELLGSNMPQDMPKNIDTCIENNTFNECRCGRAYIFLQCLWNKAEKIARIGRPGTVSVGDDDDDDDDEGGSSIRDTITNFLNNMGETVLTVLNVLTHIRDVLAAAISSARST